MAGEEPYLPFFRKTPTNLGANPPLCSSLQSIESALLLIALRRYPAALMILGQAIESAIKAGLAIPEDEYLKFDKLTMRAARVIRVPSEIAGSLKQFRDARNDFSHYGYSPKDDARSADEMLRTGLPYLEILYDGFFGFDLQGSLRWEFGMQYGIAKSVFADAALSGSGKEPEALRVLVHQIRHTFHPSFVSDLEYEVLDEARSTMALHGFMDNKRRELSGALDPCWFLDCPICGEINCVGAQLDIDALNDKVVSLVRVLCLSCGLDIPPGVPLLADQVCAEQIERESARILDGLGIE